MICNFLEDLNYSTCYFSNSTSSDNLSNCWSLTKLHEGFGNFMSFMNLNLSSCSRLTTLPEGLGKLTPLTMLDLSGCSQAREHYLRVLDTPLL